MENGRIIFGIITNFYLTMPKEKTLEIGIAEIKTKVFTMKYAKFSAYLDKSITSLVKQEQLSLIEGIEKDVRELPHSDDTEHFQAGEENTISRIVDILETKKNGIRNK